MKIKIDKIRNIVEIDLNGSSQFDVLLEIIRNFPDKRKFNSDTKLWEMSILEYNVRYFMENLFDFLVDESDKSEFLEISKSFTIGKLIKEPAHDNKITWNCDPYQHQRTGFNILVNNKYAAFFWEQGVGKTLPIIKFIENFRLSGGLDRVLIVCPKNVIIPWKLQFEEFTENCFPIVIQGNKKDREKILNTKPYISLINYDLLKTMQGELIKQGFDMVVFDESQYVKNPTSQRSKSAYEIAKNIDRRYLLTGTPIGNRELDIFQQFKILDPGVMGDNFYKFRGYYLESSGGYKFVQWKENDVVIRKAFHLLDESEIQVLKKEKGAIVIDTGKSNSNFSLKKDKRKLFQDKIKSISWRLTKGMVLDLPDKTWQSVHLELSKKQRQHYDAVANEILDIPGLEDLNVNVLIAKMGKLNQICSGFLKVDEKRHIIFDEKTKIEAMSTMWEDIGKPKVTIWCFFHREMDLIIDYFKSKKVKVGKIDGRNKKGETEKYVKEFQNGDLEILVCQEDAASVGLTLTAAHYAFIHIRTYSLLNRLQLEDRMHRIGQKENVTIIDFIYQDTIEEQILEALKQKREISRDALGDNSAFTKNIVKAFKKMNKNKKRR